MRMEALVPFSFMVLDAVDETFVVDVGQPSHRASLMAAEGTTWNVPVCLLAGVLCRTTTIMMMMMTNLIE
jgi:hypothetical protein